MRTWFRAHPNVGLVLCCVMAMVSSWRAFDYATDGRWGWMAFNAVMLVAWSAWSLSWWERT